jgi:hypothetical protein
MEHTISLHDSEPPVEAAAEFEPPSSSFEASYDEAGFAEVPYETPANLHQFPSNGSDVEDGWIQEAPPEEPGEPATGGDAMRRIVLRMSGGENVELAVVSSQSEAVAIAREFVRRVAQAETVGEWPEFEGRFLRPDGIVSVDVEVAY